MSLLCDNCGEGEPELVLDNEMLEDGFYCPYCWWQEKIYKSMLPPKEMILDTDKQGLGDKK